MSKSPKISGLTLSRYKSYPRLSDETTAFNADLLLDGRKVGDAENQGQGGATFVHLDADIIRYPESALARRLHEATIAIIRRNAEETIAAAEDDCLVRYAKETLDDLANGRPVGCDGELATAVDYLVDEQEAAKEKVRFEKAIAKAAEKMVAKGWPIVYRFNSARGVEIGASHSFDRIPLTHQNAEGFTLIYSLVVPEAAK
jgi:hypothetical protein